MEGDDQVNELGRPLISSTSAAASATASASGSSPRRGAEKIQGSSRKLIEMKRKMDRKQKRKEQRMKKEKEKHQKQQQKMKKHAKKLPPVEVEAPSDLPEGYELVVESEGERVVISVPPGGVIAGDTFIAMPRPYLEPAHEVVAGSDTTSENDYDAQVHVEHVEQLEGREPTCYETCCCCCTCCLKSAY